jgi:hypothetical protein
MVRPDHLSDDAAAVLAWLWDLDMGAGGYTRRGVRGWARREDVERGTGMRLPEILPRLRTRGLVVEELLQIPGTRPTALYRISGLGDLLLARRQGREPRPPWPAGDPQDADVATYLPPGASIALRLLRDASANPGPSQYPKVGPGWRTQEELWARLEPELERSSASEDSGPWLPGDPPWKQVRPLEPRDSAQGFGRVDLDWLERAGMAERMSITPPGRTRPVVLWRLNARREPIMELTWHEPRARGG